MASHAATQSILKAAKAVVVVFNHGQSSPLDAQLRINMENQLDRFKIWAGNLGVFAPKNASADHRLQDDEDVREVIVQMLNRLKQRLKQAINPPILEEAEESQGNGEESDDSNSSMAISLDRDCDADIHIELGDTFDPTDISRRAMADVDNIVNQLYRLAAVIRKPSSSSENVKVAKFLARQPDSPEDAEYRDSMRWQIHYRHPDASSALLERLIATVIFRRKKLEYRERHKMKLSQGFAHSEPVNRMPLLPTGMLHSDRPEMEHPGRSSPSRGSQSTYVKHYSQTLRLSATDASSVDRNRLASYSKSVALTGLTKSAIARREELDVPPPPLQESDQAEEAICPYCCRPVSKEEMRRPRWARHILKDIDPYVCLFEECAKGDECFRTVEEWVDHMSWEHCTAYSCQAEGHEDTLYHSKVEFEKHIRIEHPKAFTESQLPTLLKKSLHRSSDPFDSLALTRREDSTASDNLRVCPLCAFDLFSEGLSSGHELDTEQITDAHSKKIRHHIAAHLESIALLSLPERDDVEDGATSERTTEGGNASLDGHDLPLPDFGDDANIDLPIRTEESAADELVVSQEEWKADACDESSIQASAPLLGGPALSQIEERADLPRISITIPQERAQIQEDNELTRTPEIYSPSSLLGIDYVAPLSPDPAETGFREVPIVYKLMSALRDYRVGKDKIKLFLPVSILQELINEGTVYEYIQSTTHFPPIKARKYAQTTCSKAKSLFAILVDLKRGAKICSFLDEGISDEDLPFRKLPHDNIHLGTSSGRCIKALEGWSGSELEEFVDEQWRVMAPTFEEPEHYELGDDTLLPFMKFEQSTETEITSSNSAGYSDVYKVRIHPAHHRFQIDDESQDSKGLIAVKRLRSPDPIEFKKEVDILKALHSKKHNHLVQLLATYTHRKKHHLMFPLADNNLRQYWNRYPEPNFEATVRWMLVQWIGLVDALSVMHTYRVTHPLSKARYLQVSKDAGVLVHPGEELYGRHGDIKPENILHYRNPLGTLKIADFGLGRFHGRDSRSQVDPKNAVASPTYEPPECQLAEPVSRAYDIWSLGCVFLECITWLLKGANEVGEFSEYRGQAVWGYVSADKFFTIGPDDQDHKKAEVSKYVIQWVKKLHQDDKCSHLVHDLLELTMEKLLVCRPKDRIRAPELRICLNEKLVRADAEKEYLLKPAPWPQEPDVLQPSTASRLRSHTSDADTRRPTSTTLKSAPEPSTLVPARPSEMSRCRPKISYSWPPKSTLDGELLRHELASKNGHIGLDRKGNAGSHR